MKNKAVNALIEMGMPANIKGFRYITDAMVLFEDDDIWMSKITALYLKVAMMNETTASRVERAIRHAFSIVLTSGYLGAVEKYLTMQNTTNGNLLATFFFETVTGGIAAVWI